MFTLQARLIERWPGRVLFAVLAVTVGLLMGFAAQELPETSSNVSDSFLPSDSSIARAQDRIDESFSASSGLSTTQVLARGDGTTAAAREEIRAVVADVLDDPAVSPYTVEGGVTTADMLPSLVATGTDGAVLGTLTLVTLSENGDPVGLEAAELRIGEIVDAAETDIELSAISQSITNKENEDAQGSTTAVLMLGALAVMVVLLAVFYRSGSDVALTMTGLVLTIVWTFGAQAWLSPGALDVIQPNNPMTIMVPVMLIGLSVDYALQVSGRYREALGRGASSAPAIGGAIRRSGLPLLLAAATTAISFLTNVVSDFPAIRDFGLVAAIGLMFGFVVMTTCVPAARTLLDRRRERLGKRVRSGALADSIPGVAPALHAIARLGVSRPMPVLGGAAIVTVLAAFAASSIDSSFNQTDFLPDGSDVVEDLLFLEDNFAGGSSTLTLLLEDDYRTVRGIQNLADVEDALANPELRPDGVIGAPAASPVTLIVDWATDAGPGDERFDADFAAFFAENQGLSINATREEIQGTWDVLLALDPAGAAEVIDLRGDGVDRALIQIPVESGDVAQTKDIVTELESLWRGAPGGLTVTGNDAVLAFVTDELTASQATSVGLTIAAALVLLVLYFGLADFRPTLGVLVVIPIGVVLVWVLGFMWLAGISYNMLTSIITALTIGIGVDYTIHLTHRFLEEQEDAASVMDAMSSAMQTTGGALLASASTTIFGFLVLLFSPLPPMRQLGLLTAVTILLSLIAAFLILPPFLALWALYHKWRSTELDAATWQAPAPRAGVEQPVSV